MMVRERVRHLYDDHSAAAIHTYVHYDGSVLKGYPPCYREWLITRTMMPGVLDCSGRDISREEFDAHAPDYFEVIRA